MHPSLNILRSSVMGCEEKYELTKKRCQEGIFLSEFEVFGQQRGSYNQISDKSLIYQISDKIESKKGRQKFWAVKWNFFPIIKVIRKFPPPQSQRQDSANA